VAFSKFYVDIVIQTLRQTHGHIGIALIPQLQIQTLQHNSPRRLHRPQIIQHLRKPLKQILLQTDVLGKRNHPLFDVKILRGQIY